MIEIKVKLSVKLKKEKITEFIKKIGRLSDKFNCYQESWEFENGIKFKRKNNIH